MRRRSVLHPQWRTGSRVGSCSGRRGGRGFASPIRPGSRSRTGDGAAVGSAPGTIDEVEAGTRSVEISAERYLPFTASIEVRGKRLEENLDATLTPAWADFTLRSNPAGATVIATAKRWTTA